MEISEKINVMQHYEAGGEVELKRKNENDTKWSTTFPTWNWTDYEYRIKEPKQKVIIQKWLCRDRDGNFIIIEMSHIDEFEHYEKVKLIESYEVEL